jgi:hypothetical protein
LLTKRSFEKEAKVNGVFSLLSISVLIVIFIGCYDSILIFYIAEPSIFDFCLGCSTSIDFDMNVLNIFLILSRGIGPDIMCLVAYLLLYRNMLMKSGLGERTTI